jgi:hypothetical protein
MRLIKVKGLDPGTAPRMTDTILVLRMTDTILVFRTMGTGLVSRMMVGGEFG